MYEIVIGRSRVATASVRSPDLPNAAELVACVPRHFGTAMGLAIRS